MIVVDASVVISSLMPEPESAVARTVIAAETCLAPDLIINECANAVWKAVKVGRVLRPEAEAALRIFPNLGVVLSSSRDLSARALEIAFALDHAAYDCFYIALAEQRDLTMVTQDARLVRKLAERDVSTARVRLLVEPAP